MHQVLNEQIVIDLMDIMGDETLMLFETFVMDSESKIIELKEHVAQQDEELIRRVAHSLKGSSRNVGATELADACEALEHAARNSELGQSEEFYQQINSAFSRVKNEIQVRFPSE